MSIANSRKLGSWDIKSICEFTAEIVAKESGNVLGEAQMSMVINRIKKRMLDLGDLDPNEYYDHLIKNYDRESTHLVSLLTTHHTFFFREFCHFEFIVSHLDEIVRRVKARGDHKIRVLSAACSRGQEVYSLSMLFNHHLKQYPGMDFEILGTDIDPESIKVAQNGVYLYREVKSIPQIYLGGNWQKGTGEIAHFAKVKEQIKKKCSFSTMNLMKPDEVISGNKFDIIMCRNVFIYFNMNVVEEIVQNMKGYLHKGGYFISGLSESLKSLSIEKETLAASVYNFDKPEKVDEPIENQARPIRPEIKPAITPVLIPKPIRMLCVDDSKSILKLLSKIFSSDPEFELVGVAENGEEAEKFLAENQVDAMTLDIHMPVLNGVDYLKKNFNSSHPKVVVVSSASREDSRYALQTIRHGASDFVEKPALNNLQQRADEIKNKIKMSFLNSSVGPLKIDSSFEKKFQIEDVDTKARFLIASFSDKKKLESLLGDLKGDQPSSFIFFEGSTNFLDGMKDELGAKLNLEVFEPGMQTQSGRVYLCDFERDFEEVTRKFDTQKISLGALGIVSSALEKQLMEFSFGQILIEDNDLINESIKEVASDVFPWTSFSHIGTEFLAMK